MTVYYCPLCHVETHRVESNWGSRWYCDDCDSMYITATLDKDPNNDIAQALAEARHLPEGDLLREILLGLVPAICGMDIDPEVRMEVMHDLWQLLTKYGAKCNVAYWELYDARHPR